MGQSASPEDVSRQFFHLGVLDRAFSALSEDGKIPEAHRARLMASMVSALQSHDGSRVLAFVDRANALPAGELRELAMSYVERHVDGHQQAIIDKLDTLEPAMAQRMLALVSQTLGAGAVDMLKPLLTSPNAALKCEATALLSDSPDALGKQLVHLLGSSDDAIRTSALTTMLRHEVRQAGPGLIGVIEGERFRTRPPAEQRHMFDTLYALHPPRAEKLLIGIVKQHGMLADEELDRIRCVAAESLGHNADSVAPLPALEDAARLRPWNTQALRAAASNGIAAIRDRLRTLQEARG
jgi:hypothetical protein